MLPSFGENFARQDVRAPFLAYRALKVEEIIFLSTCLKVVFDVARMSLLVLEACVSFNVRVIVVTSSRLKINILLLNETR